MELSTVIDEGKKVVENLGNQLGNMLSLEKENSFFESKLGQAIDSGINTGIRLIMPDKIEDEIIEIKNALVQGGLREATSKAIQVTIQSGKEIAGTVGEVFKDITSVKNALEKGNIITGVSKAIDITLDKVKDAKLLPKEITGLIKAGKDLILSNTTKSIEDTLKNQVKSVQNIDKYCTSWQQAYEKGDLKAMEKQIKNIDKELEKVAPLEDTIKKSNQIKNQYEILKNKSKNREDLILTEEEKELCKKFV